VHRSIRILAAGSASGLVAAGLLAAQALAATGAAGLGSAPAARSSVSPARLPLSARQLEADRERHAKAAHASGSVTGLVQAPDGEPLAGICVVAYGSSGARLGVTSAAGRYFVADLQLGTYQLRYQNCQDPSRYLPAWYGGSTERAGSAAVKVTQSRLQALHPVTLRTRAEASPTRDLISTSSPAATAGSVATALGLPSAGTGTFRALAEPATAAKDGHIAGTVTTTGHKPLRGICVQAIRASGDNFSMTSTGKNGHYTTGRLPAGRYVVVFFPGCGNNGNWLFQFYKNNPATPTIVRVRAGHTTTGINAALALGGEISGTVTNTSGKKLSDICVGPISTAAESGGSFSILLLGTQSSGSYHVHSVPPGSYKVLFEPCGLTSPYAAVWWHNAPTFGAGQVLRVKRAQKVTGINAAMPVGGVISGTVTDAGSKPVSRMCVYAQANTDDFYTPSFFGQATTSATGQYTIEGLSAGTYTLQTSTGCGNNGDYLPTTSSAFAVQLGGTYTQDVTLQLSASVAGTVTSKVTGKPLAGICVVMWSDSVDYGGGIAPTRADGSYLINNQVPPGTYYVAFFGGCGNKGSYGQSAYDSPSPYSPAPVKVTTFAQAVSGIDGAVPPGAAIAGVVTSAGKKLTGICVAPVGGGIQQGFATTSNGRYRVADLQPGQYLMEFVPGCGDKQQNKAEQNLVGAYFGSQTDPPLVSARVGTTDGIDARLVLGGTISGKVRTHGGKAVPVACVALTGLSGAAVADSGIGLEIGGSYSFSPVIPGSYNVTFVPDCLGGSYYENQWYKDKPSPVGAATVKITAGHTTGAVNSALTAAGSIAGYITSGGQPVHDMCVFAQNVTQFLDFGSAVTNKTGHYVLRGLNSGRYELEIEPCGYASRLYAGTVLTKIVRVTAPRKTGGVNLSAQLGGSIAGQVLGDSPVTAQAGICVDAFETTGLAANGYITADGGKFSITNLPAGQYYVYLNDPGCAEAMTDLAPQWYPAAATPETATAVTVTAGGVTTLPASTLQPDGAISGTVSAAGHGPLSGACVVATSSLPGTQPVYSVTRANGEYAVLGLAPGSFEVEFSSGCGATGYKPQWWKNRNSPAGVTLVPVTAGTTTAGVSATLHT
jgi:Carboxypeptidase regulatory-like domain